jgi:hypothetical protein
MALNTSAPFGPSCSRLRLFERLAGRLEPRKQKPADFRKFRRQQTQNRHAPGGGQQEPEIACIGAGDSAMVASLCAGTKTMATEVAPGEGGAAGGGTGRSWAWGVMEVQQLGA